ncbi:MAG TPA: PspC domain-containing protein [Chloroflexia bacterium]|nr:PspC domain-containing protein [Chloroflexia bacterium]
MNYKRLARSNNVMFAGVAAGLAEYFNLDPTLVRVLFVALGIISGFFPALFVYLVLWFIMPRYATQ